MPTVHVGFALGLGVTAGDDGVKEPQGVLLVKDRGRRRLLCCFLQLWLAKQTQSKESASRRLAAESSRPTPSYRVLLRRRRSPFLLGGHGDLAAVLSEVVHALAVLPPEVHEGLQVLQMVLRGERHPVVLLPRPEVRRGLGARRALAPLQGGRTFWSVLTHQQHGGAADQPDGAGAMVVLVRPGPQVVASVSVVVWTEHIVDLPEHSSTGGLPAERQAPLQIAGPSFHRLTLPAATGLCPGC